MLLRREIFIVGAGRTDAGVHARLMVAHLSLSPNPSSEGEGNNSTDSKFPDRVDLEWLQNLTFKLNGVLPPDISIIKIVPVHEEAHARFSPVSRTYRYYVTTSKSPFNRNYSYRIFWEPDVKLMNEAAQKLFDYIDFTSFSKLHTDVKTNNCRIMEAHWEQNGDEYVFTIKADRFLRNMVRAIVGTLLLVGRHKLTVEQFCRIIEGKDRCIAGDSAPARALFLEDIEYPESLFIH